MKVSWLIIIIIIIKIIAQVNHIIKPQIIKISNHRVNKYNDNENKELVEVTMKDMTKYDLFSKKDSKLNYFNSFIMPFYCTENILNWS